MQRNCRQMLFCFMLGISIFLALANLWETGHNTVRKGRSAFSRRRGGSLFSQSERLLHPVARLIEKYVEPGRMCCYWTFPDEQEDDEDVVEDDIIELNYRFYPAIIGSADRELFDADYVICPTLFYEFLKESLKNKKIEQDFVLLEQNQTATIMGRRWRMPGSAKMDTQARVFE